MKYAMFFKNEQELVSSDCWCYIDGRLSDFHARLSAERVVYQRRLDVDEIEIRRGSDDKRIFSSYSVIERFKYRGA